MTQRPITPPARKATLRPSFREFFAAAAVRAEALVAVFMPKKPQSPESRPAIGTPIAATFSCRPAKPITIRAITSSTKTIETTFHC